MLLLWLVGGCGGALASAAGDDRPDQCEACGEAVDKVYAAIVAAAWVSIVSKSGVQGIFCIGVDQVCSGGIVSKDRPPSPLSAPTIAKT